MELVSRKIFRGRMKGERRSPRKGRSVEFADFRNYAVGDDLRYVDWNAFARLDRLFLKLFVEEEDLYLHLLLDCSRSMAFGEPSKLDYARRAAAALAYVALKSLDRVGMAAFCDGLKYHLPPTRGPGQAMRVFDWLEKIEAGGPTDLAAPVREYALRATRPGVAILISDFLHPGYEEGLRALLGRRFEISVLHVMDEKELNPDLLGDLRLVDSETGEEREVTITPGLLRDYRRALDDFCDQVRGFCLRYGINYMRVSTAHPFEDLILRMLRRAGWLK